MQNQECPFHDQDGVDVCTCEKEWWETDLRRMFHGVWAASPHNEQRMTDAAIEAIKPIFAEHRKRVVREIREAIKKEALHSPVSGTEAMFQDTYNEAIVHVLILDCLKENE